MCKISLVCKSILYLSHAAHVLHRRYHICGALTTGYKWIFVTIDLNSDCDSVKYQVSEPIEWQAMATKDKDLTSNKHFIEPSSKTGVEQDD